MNQTTFTNLMLTDSLNEIKLYFTLKLRKILQKMPSVAVVIWRFKTKMCVKIHHQPISIDIFGKSLTFYFLLS